jgi:hypothetical protein
VRGSYSRRTFCFAACSEANEPPDPVDVAIPGVGDELCCGNLKRLAPPIAKLIAILGRLPVGDRLEFRGRMGIVDGPKELRTATGRAVLRRCSDDYAAMIVEIRRVEVQEQKGGARFGGGRPDLGVGGGREACDQDSQAGKGYFHVVSPCAIGSLLIRAPSDRFVSEDNG